nr:RNA-directed DNA polymerase, eukaryota, reverse transcriptase zinc-binding domain protein [Tanacetum cinerariifolium]
MGSYRTKEDDVYKISNSVFITNFPESCSAKELFQSCKQCGHVVDTFLPNKRSKTGRSFGFVRFINVFNEERLVNNIWDSMKLFQDNVSRLSCSRIIHSSVSRLSGEGFLDIDDQDEMCFHSKRLRIYTKSEKNIFEEFKIIFRGRPFWIHAKEAPGWVPDFMEENDDEEQNDDGGFNIHESGSCGGDSDVEGVLETIFEESGQKENNLDEEHTDKHKNYSGDPISIYKLLKKKKDNVEKENNSEHSMKYPPGFTPKEVTDVVGMHEEESRSDNIVNLSDHNAKEVNNTFSGNCPKKNSKEDVSNSVCSGHFKTSMVPHTGGSILSLMDELVKVGQVMGYKMDGCNSGGILCVWDPNSFRKRNATVSDYFIMIRGVWRQTGNDLLIIAVYAPHDLKDKHMLWDYLTYKIGKWKGEVVIMGDFNEVWYKSDRFRSVFNVQGANVFNSFITNAGLEEVPLGGSSFTWCHKSATKMSKLDRFLISKNLLNTCPNITSITLERYLSDHRPILLHESHFDYGPTPFRFFHHWIEMEGFSKVVEDAWREGPCDESNAMIKLKYLKTKFQEWNKKNMLSAKNVKAKYKDELEALEAIIDKGSGNVEAKVKWSIEGDENTSFFHGMLNKKQSLLNIWGIMVDGMWIESLNRVKGEFFHHFSSRFDKPDAKRAHIEMRYSKTLTWDQQVELESDMSNEEIKRAVWDCGIDNPQARMDSHLVVIPKGCNSSFIALIPKISDANMVKDFIPISLIGSLYKIVANILAIRLVVVLGDIVNKVQSTFIPGRQILDGPFILNEVLQLCKIKRKQSLTFKVDFEKAYDSVWWDFLDDILKKFGFGEKWCLKQGDPLSPFLFILIMESLHLSFQRVVDARIFKGIKLSSSLSTSHMFYADYVVFVGQWCDGNITTLVHVLECFYRASGLRINMSKSKIMGVLMDSDKVKCAASRLGCIILKTSFSYLGLKVGGSMSRVHTWNEVVDRVKNRLSKWKMKTLSIGGRLTLLKSVLGSMPIFHMFIFRAPLTVLRTLESIRIQFFKGQELNSKKASWVNWKKVLAPKEKGGLGVSSLYALNRGLMFKWITQNTSLWVWVIKPIHGDDIKVRGYVKDGAKSCWLSIVNEINSLKNKGINLLDFMQVKLGNGDKTAFWEDIWIEGRALKNGYPRMYSLVTCKLITVGMKLAQSSLDSSFRRVPRGGVEQEKFDELSALVHDITLTPMSDRWIWALKSLGDFSVASVRKITDDKSLPKVDSKTRWIKYVPMKIAGRKNYNAFWWIDPEISSP